MNHQDPQSGYRIEPVLYPEALTRYRGESFEVPTLHDALLRLGYHCEQPEWYALGDKAPQDSEALETALIPL